MNIGSLTIELAANVGRLQQDMAQAKGTVDGAMRAISSSVDIAKTAFVGLTGIASTGVFISMINDVIAAKVELQRMSVQTGASVESLSAISAVAKMTGTDVGAVGAAMNKLQKAMASANEDSKGAAAALKALGINFAEFKQLKADEQMLQVAKAMDQFQDGGGKSAAAMLLLGKSGATLLPMLQELAEKNELIGKTTAESAKQAELYEKNMKQLELAGGAWKRQMVDGMLPALISITDAMVAARKEGGMLSSFWAGAKVLAIGSDEYRGVQELNGAIQEMINLKSQRDQFLANGGAADSGYVNGLNIQIELARKNVGALQDQRIELQKLSDAKKQVEQNRKDTRAANGQVDVHVPDAAAAAAELKLYTSAMQGLEQQLGALNHQTEFQKVMYQVTEGSLTKLTASHKAYLLSVAGEVDLQKEALKISTYQNQVADDYLRREEQMRLAKEEFIRAGRLAADSLLFEISLIGVSATEVQKLMAVRAIDLEVQQRIRTMQEQAGNDPIAIKQIQGEIAEIQRLSEIRKRATNDSLDDANRIKLSWSTGVTTAITKYLDDVANAAKQSEQLFGGAFKSMEDAVVSFVKTGKVDFSNFTDYVITEMIRMQVQQSITGPLAGMMSGGGLAAMLAGMSGSGTPNGWDYGPSMPARAAGGPVSAGQPYLVGEKGPEIIIPSGSGTVLPNGQGGGGSVINHYSAVSIDSRTDRADVFSGVQRALQRNNEQLVGMLRQQGVLA